jgi:hypothetical protein
MNEQEYLETRVTDQISWYDKKSLWNKKMFIRLKVLETIFALMIPFLIGYITTERIELKLTVGFIGIVVAVVTNVVTLLKLQENWIEYRTVAESLKHEKFMFVTRSGPYTIPNDLSAFVERFESLISQSNTKWASLVNKPIKDKPQ